MPHFNEHALELSIMELFQQEGYTYTSGEEIHKEVSDVLLRDDMRLYLHKRYKAESITPLEIERTITMLTANVGFSLYEQNRHTYRLMTEGFSLKREDAALPDLFIEPIDFSKDGIKNNLFRIVNQLEIQGAERRIPDGIVYVNGLPVVVLEFKSAVKEETTIMDAYTQLTVRYRRDIPDLFKYNAFVVISDGVNNKYGSLFSPYDFFYAWRKVEANDKATDGINSLLTMVKGLFQKERLLSVIKDFVFFPDSSKNEKKVVCRYPQFFAAILCHTQAVREYPSALQTPRRWRWKRRDLLRGNGLWQEYHDAIPYPYVDAKPGVCQSYDSPDNRPYRFG